MKYISIDVETTGLDTENDQILSIAAIIEDSNNPLPFQDIPKIHIAIKRERISGSMFAINMNKELIKRIVHYQTAGDQDEKNDMVQMTGMIFLDESEVVEALYQFCYINGIVELDPDYLAKTSKVVNGVRYPMLTSSMPKVHITCAGSRFY